MNDIQSARALAVFGIVLGAMELACARGLSRVLGLGDPRILRAFGVREIANGVAIMTSPDGPGPVWGRVAGDVLDVATLGSVMGRSNDKRGNATIAVALVGGIMVLDVLAALALSDRASRARRTAQRTRIARA